MSSRNKSPRVQGGEPGWNYEDPAPLGEKLLLLTTGGTAVIGTWAGMRGDMYLAWSWLPRRDKEAESHIYHYVNSLSSTELGCHRLQRKQEK